jgi:hypothetical protein
MEMWVEIRRDIAFYPIIGHHSTVIYPGKLRTMSYGIHLKTILGENYKVCSESLMQEAAGFWRRPKSVKSPFV